MHMRGLFLIIISFLVFSLYSDIWWEESGEIYNYDLSDFYILIVIGDDFDYNETIIIKKHWENWGAKVDIAGPQKELLGHQWMKKDDGWDNSTIKKINTDLLIREVNISDYDVIFFPGGSSPKNLLKSDSLTIVELVRNAKKTGLVLAGICHGPHIFAASGVVDGKEITGHYDIREYVLDARGKYVNKVYSIDGNIITGNWPYFETMAVKVAEKLLYPDGNGPSEKSPFKINPVLNAIYERRSIRNFTDKDVSQDTINLILRAASWAPSSNNEQPWRFIVVRQNDTKQKLLNELLDRMKDYYEKHDIPLDRVKSYWSKIFKAPVFIFVFCEEGKLDDEWYELQNSWNIQSTSSATQNILLAAHSLNLGSLWYGISLVVEDEIKNILKVPANFKLITAIAIGYPSYKPLPPVRKPLRDVTSFEEWRED